MAARPARAPAARAGERPRILVVCGHEPNPITLRKIDALHRSGDYEVHLAFWRSTTSSNNYPFTTDLPPSAIHPIDLRVPRELGHLLLRVVRGNVLLLRFHRRLSRIIRALQPDLIHASNSQMLICGWLASIGRADRALVYRPPGHGRGDATVAGCFGTASPASTRRSHLRSSLRFVTDFLRPLRLISPECHPTVIANAPWRATFAGIPPARGRAFVVGYIGSFRCQPAIEWLVDSVRTLRGKGVDVALLFAGSGWRGRTSSAWPRPIHS